MDKITTPQPVIRELKLEECQQVSGGLLSVDMDPDDFPVIALPRINVAINSKIFTAKTYG